jgi:hypothetical protein
MQPTTGHSQRSAKTPMPTFEPKDSEVASLQLRLRQVRAYLKWSPAEMATRLSSREVTVTERDVKAWEAAERRPSPAQFDALVRVTEVDLTWLKTGQAAPPSRKRNN